MAPEDILRSVDKSRRDFLRTLITGTAFAVPLMASFSMEGLSLDPAEASLVSNSMCGHNPGPPCCELAQAIAVDIGCVMCCGGYLLSQAFVSPAVKARLFDPLAKALHWMDQGMMDLDHGCQSNQSMDRFKKARKEMGKFFDLLEELCGPSHGLTLLIENLFGYILGAIDSLLENDCPGGASILQSSRNALKSRLPARP